METLKIFIDGPQGSGKSTLARHLSDKLACSYKRGIPEGKILLSATPFKIWRQSQRLALEQINAAYDRSIISLYCHGIRREPQKEQIFTKLTESIIDRIRRKFKNAIFVIINSELDMCLTRQGTGPCSIPSESELKAEIESYKKSHELLQRTNTNYIKVDNFSQSVDAFQDGVLKAIRNHIPITSHR